jgi:hypothetical protein
MTFFLFQDPIQGLPNKWEVLYSNPSASRKKKKDGGMAQVVEHLPSRILSNMPSYI